MTTDELFDFGPSAILPEGYTADDSYRDFRRVFLDDEAGQRVLSQILNWTRMFQVTPPRPPIDPYLLAYHEGERHIGALIRHAITTEPKQRPTKARSKKSG